LVVATGLGVNGSADHQAPAEAQPGSKTDCQRQVAAHLKLNYTDAQLEDQRIGEPYSGFAAIDSSDTVLHAEAFTALPSAWVEQLYQATLCGDDVMIVQLLDHLPPEQNLLAEELRKLAYQFQFDIILSRLEGHLKE
jgi:hypothetical protein